MRNRSGYNYHSANAKIPVASFKTDPSFNMKFAVPAPINFINSSANADFYEWDFGDGQTSSEIHPRHIYTQNGIFKIKLTAFSNNGCFNSVVIGDLLIKDDAAVFTLNAFSPNGDGVNDELVVGITNLKKYRISIYNRYGTELFASNDIYQNWKGTHKNTDVHVGVYYYVINAVNLDNEAIKYSGSITLIR
ncbi:gliding motility-associated C-terminal domain-containing protein [Pedobacter sp. AW1-32]|uniref:T9SS type B sorting domain-containing protein n=1 Tax=Pedobacter sp. AW1-32 TaxID=3383026 RepID=UPI003FEEBFF5